MNIRLVGDEMEERLQKFMASCGVGSRRKCEEIILSGRVSVNKITIKELGFKVDPFKDIVCLDHKELKPEENKIYVALHKPVGYISSAKDERGRKTILDIVKVKERIYPIGRLDYDTSGLILLTNDGDVYNRVIHPRQEVHKIYLAKVTGIPSRNAISYFETGVDIEGYITAPASFQIYKKEKENSWVRITIHEGKNRQIRRMCDAIGHPVLQLKRVSVGNITLGDLKTGEWRYLEPQEIDYLKEL